MTFQTFDKMCVYAHTHKPLQTRIQTHYKLVSFTNTIIRTFQNLIKCVCLYIYIYIEREREREREHHCMTRFYVIDIIYKFFFMLFII